jgi:hypothetical protein
MRFCVTLLYASSCFATLLLLGDVNVEQRADPPAAMIHVRPTLKHADLVYGNLEGLRVNSLRESAKLPQKAKDLSGDVQMKTEGQEVELLP